MPAKGGGTKKKDAGKTSSRKTPAKGTGKAKTPAKKTGGKKAEAPESVPDFVRDASPAERKAAVEALAAERGILNSLAKAPWKRPKAEAAGAPGGEKPAGRTPKRLEMTKPPAEEAPKPSTRAGPRPVLVDTNALMMQFQFHIDIERELKRLLDFRHEIVVPSTVIDELTFIVREGKGKDAGEARMAIALAKTFKTVEAPGEGDTSILRLAEKLNAIVVTNDKILRARLRAKDIPNVYMRSSAFLTIEGHITGV